MGTIFGIDVEAMRNEIAENKRDCLAREHVAEKYGELIANAMRKSISQGYNFATIRVSESDKKMVVWALRNDGFSVPKTIVPTLVFFRW